MKGRDHTADRRVRRAVLFAGSAPSLRVGGRPLVERALIVLSRAGVEECYVVGQSPPERRKVGYPRTIRRIVDHGRRAVDELRAEGVKPEEPVLFLHTSLLTEAPALRSFVRGTSFRGSLATAEGEPLPLLCATTEKIRELWEPLRRGDGAALARGAREAGFEERPLEGFAAVVRTREEAERAVTRLLLSLENPRDGVLDRWLRRRLSRPLSRFFLRFPFLRPNHVTALSFLTAVLSAWAFSRGNYGAGIAGALLFEFSSVLDCSDGEVARVKLEESRFGDLLDITLDAAGNLLVFLGIAAGVWPRLPSAGLLGAILAAGIAVAFPVVSYVERRLPERGSLLPRRAPSRRHPEHARFLGRDFPRRTHGHAAVASLGSRFRLARFLGLARGTSPPGPRPRKARRGKTPGGSGPGDSRLRGKGEPDGEPFPARAIGVGGPAFRPPMPRARVVAAPARSEAEGVLVVFLRATSRAVLARKVPRLFGASRDTGVFRAAALDAGLAPT
ncbi:MAG: hypothetical protein KatS3mg076_2814 [Candidatus Binatia bacterium]|nr:MAG: hypothetical protein KatS3mg076_2814 [Candidatus Binatia bacterium]